MGKLSSVFNSLLLAVSVFLIYSLDKNMHMLVEQHNCISTLSEEIRMARNYREYSKINSNNFVSSFCNISNILDNPLQFILFCTYKNESLSILDNQSMCQMTEFISHCASDQIKNNIKNVEKKIVNLFKSRDKTNSIAVEMLISIVKKCHFDSFLYPYKLQKLVYGWYKINQFVLEKINLSEKELNNIVKFIMLYKISEMTYL